MDAPTRVAVYFGELIERCNRCGAGKPTGLPLNDQYIFYVLSTRCEMDMNGFESVFDQLLDESELNMLISALNEFGAGELAQAFSIAKDRLAAAGFFQDEEMMVCDLASDDAGFLDDVEAMVRTGDLMWQLDEYLAERYL